MNSCLVIDMYIVVGTVLEFCILLYTVMLCKLRKGDMYF